MVQAYMALLRAINVGGNRKIKMEDLRACFAAWGFPDARTYIQSGNVVFRADEAEEPLRRRLEAGIAEAFGFHVTVVLRTAQELATLLASSPFPPDTLADGENLYVACLASTPTPGAEERLASAATGRDACQLVGREVYLLYRQPSHESKLTNAWLERATGTEATTRNWRTLTALAALLGEGARE